MQGKRIVLSLSLIIVCSFTYGQVWQQYADTAKQFLDSENFEKAIEYFSKAKELFPADSAETEYSFQLSKNIGFAYLRLSEYEEAEPFYQEARNLFKKLNGTDKPEYAVLCDRLGQIYFFLHPSEAEQYFLESKEIREKLFGNQSSEYAISCNGLGNLYSKLGQNEKAIAIYTISRDIRAKVLGKQDPDYAQSCNNLANVYRVLGLYEKAEPLVNEAAKIRSQLKPVNNHPTYAITLTNLGNLYRDMGQFEKSEFNYLKAKKIRGELQPKLKHLDYAESCNILADLYYLMEEYKKAEPLYVEAMNIRRNKSLSYAQTCNNLANLYLNVGKFDKAESLALEAKEEWTELPEEDPNRTINNNTLGAINLEKGNYAEAESYLMKAKQVWERKLGSEHPYVIQNAYNLARVYWNSGQLDKAKRLYADVIYTQSGQVNKFFGFTTEEEKGMFLKNITSSTDENLSFYYTAKDFKNAGSSYDISLLNRNLIGKSVQNLRTYVYQSADSNLRRVYDQWTDVKMQLARIYSRGEKQNEETKRLEEKAESLEKELSQNSAIPHSAGFERKNWQDIKNKLNEDEAAIEFTSFRYYNGKRWTDSVFYVGLLLKKNLDQPLLIPLCEEKQLESLLKSSLPSSVNSTYRGGIVNNSDSNPNRELYPLIWKPIQGYLSGISKLYYASAGNLHKVSFAAIAIDDQNVLSDLFQLIQLNSTSSITDKKEILFDNSDKVQLYGAVQYNADPASLKKITAAYHKGNNKAMTRNQSRNESFVYLPGTKKEVDEIKKLATSSNISAELLSGINCTEESFKALTGATSPAVLHIATHGFYFPDPALKNMKTPSSARMSVFIQSGNPLMRSGLVFAGANTIGKQKTYNDLDDGILTAYEVSNMYLPNTKLVVLSACESGLGEIQGSEGVYGLQRSFKIAGAEYLLMSLWEVPDLETSEFMTTFYKNVFDNKDISQAFYQTQDQLKKKYKNEPYKWAAWILLR